MANAIHPFPLIDYSVKGPVAVRIKYPPGFSCMILCPHRALDRIQKFHDHNPNRVPIAARRVYFSHN